MTISNHDSLSSCKTGVNSAVKAHERLIWINVMSEIIGGISFKNEQRVATLKPDLKFDSLKPTHKRSIFKCISWLINTSFSRGDKRRFLLRGSQGPIKCQSLYNSPAHLAKTNYRCLHTIPHDHLLLDSAPNIGPLISRWEPDKVKNCWNKSFRISKSMTLLYQQFTNFLISQRDMSGPRLGALSNNRW